MYAEHRKSFRLRLIDYSRSGAQRGSEALGALPCPLISLECGAMASAVSGIQYIAVLIKPRALMCSIVGLGLVGFLRLSKMLYFGSTHSYFTRNVVSYHRGSGTRVLHIDTAIKLARYMK